MSKFCEECGFAFSKTGAKFCGNCGSAASGTVSSSQPEHTKHGAEWAVWINSYKPTLNVTTTKNEALFGYYYPNYGVSKDWIAQQDIEYVWSVFAQEDFEPLILKSGHYEGPRVMGYVLCEVGVPEDDDLELALPEEFVGFHREVILCRDKDSQKWRPCGFELLGDTTANVPDSYQSGFEDRYLEFQNKLEQQRRQSEQIMYEFSAESIEELERIASLVDRRYFLAVLFPVSGWSENTGVAIHYLADYIHESDPEEISLVQVRGRVPEGELERTAINGGEINLIQVGWPNSCVHDREDDCSCWVDASGNFYGSVDDTLHLNRFQVNLKLKQPIRNEGVFREKTAKKLFEIGKAGSFKDWTFTQRAFDEWSEPEFALAFNRREFAYNNLSEFCPSCLTLNPKSAQVCYSCCHQLVPVIDGTLFASLSREFGIDDLTSMKPAAFSSWVNIYYFVASTNSEPVLLEEQIPVFGY